MNIDQIDNYNISCARQNKGEPSIEGSITKDLAQDLRELDLETEQLAIFLLDDHCLPSQKARV